MTKFKIISEENSRIEESALNDSNVVNSTKNSSVESIEIAATDDESETTDSSDEEQIGKKHKKIISRLVDSDSSDEEQEKHPVSDHEHYLSDNQHQEDEEELSESDHADSEGEEDPEIDNENKPPPKGVLIEDEAESSNHDEESSDSESSNEEVVAKKRLSIAQKRQSFAHKRRSMGAGLIDPDTSDEEEEVVQRRQTLYQEQPEGDIEDPVEDQAFSRATRRSIFGAPTIKEEAVSFNKAELDESDSEGDIIVSDSEDDKENSNTKRTSQLSSTLRSPLKDETNSLNSSREESAMNVSPVNSSVAMHTSPENSSAVGSSRDASSAFASPTESPNVSEQSGSKFVKVSRAAYEEACRDRDSITNKLKLVDNKAFLAQLPDKGAKLLDNAVQLKEELKKICAKIKNMVIDDEDSISNRIKRSMHEDSSLNIDDSNHDISGAAALPTKPTNYLNAEDVQPKFVGKVGMKNFLNAKALTVETLQTMHKTLDDRPADDALAEPPKYLKIELMKHQLHALSFMMWRESQKPRGGILADDMVSKN